VGLPPYTYVKPAYYGEVRADICQPDKQPLVFSGEPDKWFAELREKAGIKSFTWHDLRHTFGSRLAMRDVQVKKIAELMGHSSITTTMATCISRPPIWLRRLSCLRRAQHRRASGLPQPQATVLRVESDTAHMEGNRDERKVRTRDQEAGECHGQLRTLLDLRPDHFGKVLSRSTDRPFIVFSSQYSRPSTQTFTRTVASATAAGKSPGSRAHAVQ